MLKLPPTVAWSGGAEGSLHLLDQTRLPHEIAVLELDRLADVIAAIQRLSVRGAPAIGVAAAYGVVVGVREEAPEEGQAFHSALDRVCDQLTDARPTAVNLGWAAQRLRVFGHEHPTIADLLEEARRIHDEDIALCEAMGRHGESVIPPGSRILTHCNTGRLATSGDGTALAVVFAAHRAGKGVRVLADETRPLLQGARLTALECQCEGIPVDVVADGAAASLIARGEVDVVLTGADRVARNGDTANKIGTYGLALACAAHDVPMYIVAPTSTFDLEIGSGQDIPIEDRDPSEVLTFAGVPTAPSGVGARNPAFDVTPAGLLRGLITDRGIISPVTEAAVVDLIGTPAS